MTTNHSAGFILPSGGSRGGEPLRFLGESISIKVSGADSGGRFTVIEETTPPQGGPPLHLHKHENEWLYVLEGQFLFEMNGQPTVAAKGDSVFVPRGVPHTFQNVGAAAGRILGVTEPAGIEHFFAQMAWACRDGSADLERLQPLFVQFGLELLGPPLAARK